MVKTKFSSGLRRISFLAVALLGLAASHSASAQAVRWNLSDLDLAEGKVSQIALVFDNCSPSSDFKIPKTDGLEDFGRPVGQQSSTQIQIVNFKRQTIERYVLSYLIRPQRKGRIEIPAFDIDTTNGKVHVSALSLDVGEGSANAMQDSGNQIFTSTLETPSPTIWQGQIFPLHYEVVRVADEDASVGTNPNKWKPSDLVIEDWSQPQQIRRNIQGNTRPGLLYETHAYASKAGNLELPPLEMEAEIVTGSAFGFFGRSTSERVTMKSNPLKLTVKELPKGAPASFTGAVGQFKLESKLTQNEITAGQPVTWTLTLKGTGNWPENFKMPERNVPSNLRVIQPEAKKENAPDKIFEATLTEDVVLIPDKAGKIDLAPVQFTFFNPEKGAYETLTKEASTLTVNPDVNTPVRTPGTNIATPAPALHDDLSPAQPKAEMDLSKPMLPRDPIAGTSSSFKPMNTLVVVGTSGALVLTLLPLWLLLARRHSVDTAQITRQKKALAEALAASEQIEKTTDVTTRKNLLLRWQHLVSTGFAVEYATPSLKQLESSPNVHLDEKWVQLWREADAALYSADSNLPADWSSRARQSASNLRLPGVPMLKTLSPKHLFPLVLALLILPFASAQAASTDPLADYQKGDFAAAQKGWQQQADQHPGDWITHNNLGLALAQEKEWVPAVAQWTSAFLRRPGSSDVEWNLALGLGHMDTSIPELENLQRAELLPALARLLSPAQWQTLSLIAVLAAVAAAAFMLFRRYHPVSPAAKFQAWIPQSIIILGVIAFVTALIALNTYGVLGDSRAGMIVSKAELRSVPTDAESKQATREITAGMVVVAEKSFLGWWKVRLANNETGWVRQEHLHRLYY